MTSLNKRNKRNKRINNKSRKNLLTLLDLYNFPDDYSVNEYGFGSALKNAFSDAFNLEGLNSIAKAGIGGLGSAVGKIGEGLIAGGKSSGVGNAIGNIGGTVGSAIGAVNPVAGALVGAASGIIGGGVNALFGSKLNEERIALAENEINAAKSFNANANNFDDLALLLSTLPIITGFSLKDIGSDGWFSNKAEDKYNSLLALKELAETWINNSVANNITNLLLQQMNNLLLNYTAYGGLLDINNQYSDGGKIYIKPENRGKFTALKERTGKSATWFKEHGTPALKKMATFALNARKWKHKDGGILSTHGLDLSNGVTYINNGNTHENNIYEGVQMGVDSEGVPNLVEEGEVIFNDYVFSNRIRVPNTVRNKYKLRGTKDMTFADAAKKASKESEERPNDPISLRGLEDIMNKLANEQEAMRELRKNKRYGKLYATGGILGNKGNLFFTGGPYEYGLDILNMENYGDFNSLYKLGSDYMNKRLYIIDNWDTDYVKNWIKNTYIPSVLNYNKSRSYNSDFTVNLDLFTKGTYDNLYGGMHKGVLDFIIPEKSNNLKEAPAMNIYTTRGRRGGDISINPEALDLYGYSIPLDIVETAIDSLGNTINYLHNFTSKPITNTGSKNKDNKDNKGNKGESDNNTSGGDNLLRYAPVVGSTIGLGLTLLSKPDYSRADALANYAQNAGKVTPISYESIGDYLTYRPTDMNYIANRMAALAGATRRNIMNTSGGNRANAVGSLLAADYNSQIALADALRLGEDTNWNRYMQAMTFNRGTNLYNSEAALKAAIANQEARMKASQLGLSSYATAMLMKDAIDALRNASLSTNLTNLFDSLGDIGREEVVKKMVKNNPALLSDYFGRYKGNIGAEGGKLNKKKRGGFTY